MAGAGFPACQGSPSAPTLGKSMAHQHCASTLTTGYRTAGFEPATHQIISLPLYLPELSSEAMREDAGYSVRRRLA